MKMQINQSGLVIRKFLQVVGTIEIFRIVWIVSRYCMSRIRQQHPNIGTPKEPNPLDDLSKFQLNVDFNGIKRDMELLLIRKQNSDKALEIQESKNLRINRELQQEIEEKTQKLKTDLKSLWKSNANETKAIREALELEEEQHSDEVNAVAEITRGEMRKLNDDMTDFVSFTRKLKEEIAKTEELKEIQERLQEYLDGVKRKTIAKCEKSAMVNNVSREDEGTEMLNYVLKIQREATKKILDLETKTKTCFSELEISILGQIASEDMITLSYQPEGTPGQTTIFLWKVPYIQEKINDLLEESKPITSNDFFRVTPELRVRPVLKLRGTEAFLDINLEFKEDSKMESPFLHYRRFVLQDQSGSAIKDHFEVIDRPFFNDTENTLNSYYTKQSLCVIPDLDSTYVKDDQILIKIVLEPLAFVTNLASSDGVLHWTIDRYSKRVNDHFLSRKGWLVSSPFRTSDNGYHVHCEVHLHTEMEEDQVYIMARIKFLLGVNDHMLQNPITFTVKCLLLDQCDTGKNLTVEREFSDKDIMNNGNNWMIGKCFLRSKADNEPYCKDDTIHLLLIVDVK